MTWAEAPGWALEGSNRALLYLLVFTLFLITPWTPKAALGMLLAFVLGVGAIAILILLRFALGDHVQQLIVDGRLVAPTGYFNSSVALFMITALLAIVLAAHRELPSLLRGALIAIAGASLQLCVIGQSRGWLFTLPVVVAAIAVVRQRLRERQPRGSRSPRPWHPCTRSSTPCRDRPGRALTARQRAPAARHC